MFLIISSTSEHRHFTCICLFVSFSWAHFLTARNQLAPHMVRQPSMMSFCSLSHTKVFKHFVKNPSMTSFEVLILGNLALILVGRKIHYPVCDLLRPSELYFICDILFLCRILCSWHKFDAKICFNLLIYSFSLWIVVQTDYPWAGLHQRYLYAWGTGEVNYIHVHVLYTTVVTFNCMKVLIFVIF